MYVPTPACYLYVLYLLPLTSLYLFDNLIQFIIIGLLYSKPVSDVLHLHGVTVVHSENHVLILIHGLIKRGFPGDCVRLDQFMNVWPEREREREMGGFTFNCAVQCSTKLLTNLGFIKTKGSSATKSPAKAPRKSLTLTE